MTLKELRLIVNSENAEEISNSLLDYGALSVGIEDAFANTKEEEALFDEPGENQTGNIQLWNNSLILALFNDKNDLEAIINQLLVDFHITNLNYEISDVENKDWVKLTQAQFDSIPISDNLWIIPSWRDMNNEVSHVIRLDPGLAFGTGSHPTTFMCLAWLDAHLKNGESVLDYGCGSGILAISAKILGSKQVLGVDIDEQAIIASQENARRNNVEIDFQLAKDFHLSAPFDVVVANILANPLRLLAEMLASYVKPGGNIVLSGILEQQQQELMAIYQPWFEMTVFQNKDGWSCLSGVKLNKKIDLINK